MNDWKRPTEHSMKRRALWHDYRAPGTYMLTMAVDGRRPLLGRLLFDERRLGETIAENRRLAHVALYFWRLPVNYIAKRLKPPSTTATFLKIRRRDFAPCRFLRTFTNGTPANYHRK